MAASAFTIDPLFYNVCYCQEFKLPFQDMSEDLNCHGKLVQCGVLVQLYTWGCLPPCKNANTYFKNMGTISICGSF